MGVASDMKSDSLRKPAPPTYYLSIFREPTEMELEFALRTSGDQGALMASIHECATFEQ